MFMQSQQGCRTRLPSASRTAPEAAPGCASSSRTPAAPLTPPQTTWHSRDALPPPATSPRRCEPPAALRAPRHAYGGPEPFGIGAGILRWEREAGLLLREHLTAERAKNWKRLRHQLILNGPEPADEARLGQERVEEIRRTRLRVRFKKFWDLMNEADRPWHFDVVVRLCTALSPYTCERYNSVTAGTMQGILAQRAKAERAVRDLREDCRTLRRRLTGMTIRMARSGRPVSEEQLRQMERLEAQISAGCGVAGWQLQRLQAIARATYQDQDYGDHISGLLPLLQEAKRLSEVVRRELLPDARALQDELAAFQEDLDERRLPRDQVVTFLERLRNRYLAAADHERWPQLRPDEQVGWRYPPLQYWRTAWRSDAPNGSGGGGGGSGQDGDGGVVADRRMNIVTGDGNSNFRSGSTSSGSSNGREYGVDGVLGWD